MPHAFFLLPLLVSFSLATILLIMLILIGNKHQGVERSSGRHIHVGTISRFGGAAIILSFVLTLFLDKHLVINTPLLAVIVASLLILIFGILDDLKQIPWKWQLLFQILLVLFIFLSGVKLEYVTNPFGGLLFLSSGLGLIVTTVWIVLVMNSLNWLDGVDGAAGIVTLIAGVSVFLLSIRPEVNQPPIGIITAALAGSLLAFLLLNFHPAKIFAGTSGSMFMGFILAILAIFAGAKVATTLMVLTVPIMDAVWVVAERLALKQSIFEADDRHLHHKLLQLGWSQKKIACFYALITSAIALVALNTKLLGKAGAFGLIVLIVLSIFFVIRKKAQKIA